MKRLVSGLLVLVMVLAIIAPIVANAETAKEEILFTKMVEYFKPYRDLDLELLEEFVSDEAFVEYAYELFAEKVAANDDLKGKLENSADLKTYVVELFSKENISTILNEVKSGEGKDSLPILKDFIENVEEYFGKNWDEVVDADLIKSAQDILDGLNQEVENEFKDVFPDIESHWAQDKINALVKLGVIGGYPDGTFKPNDKVTRAEFAKMMVIALDLDLTTYSEGFTDVEVGKWYSDYIATMVAKEYVNGYPDGTFKPNGFINRMEMATIISNILEVEVSDEEKATLIANFADGNTISEWAIDSVAEVAKAEIMIGDSLKKFNPVSNATRAEAVTVIYNLINR